MIFSKFILFAMCFVYLAGGPFAQNATTATSSKTADVYLPLKKCWEYPVENIGQSTVSSDNGTVFFAESEGRVRSLNARTGRVNWVADLGGRVTALRAVPGIGIAVRTASIPGTGKDSIRLLSPDSGLVNYSVQTEVSGEAYLVPNGNRLIVAAEDGGTAAFNASTGELLWRQKLPGRLTAAPASSSEFLALATDDKKITVFQAVEGKVTGTISTRRNVTALVVLDNNTIVGGDDRGNVISYRGMFGSVWWQFKSGARVGTIFETPEGLIVGSYDNFLYFLSRYSGDVRWKRRLDGRIIFPPALFNGYSITAASSETKAQVIDIQNGRSVDQLAFGDDRFLLSSPLIEEGGVAIFTLVDKVAAYSQSGCGTI